ncbi:hypothetical protein JX265_005733 [Neoarthrinium moseri]|uniref:LysM domain-containing protein n=1 Tax=Neoarthrinium moseri TaxID=1658444 RepID=A0A9P9WMV9_9PEZI|nr:uncharacterized protein JN550_013399 [Neoarthrinium moseri]KAI1842156.1 hypothetical protein JX266_011689 [Neoarthrinium moseri]KAI1857216.1 hypothetical protein JN550_013399 [Neoarthrinium moseri]KAI1871747.1 hypothetical protein JX265_005733 [Neoarthrinium moseri]
MQLTDLPALLAAFAAFSAQVQAVPTRDSTTLESRQGFESDCIVTYVVQPGDYCNKIRDHFNDVWSLEDFYKWNPQVDSFCSNLYPGEVVCVGTKDSPTIPPSCPVPVQPGLVSNCVKCYTIKENDNCGAIELAQGISDEDFRLWNPSINAACSNLLINNNYCVGV